MQITDERATAPVTQLCAGDASVHSRKARNKKLDSRHKGFIEVNSLSVFLFYLLILLRRAF